MLCLDLHRPVGHVIDLEMSPYQFEQSSTCA